MASHPPGTQPQSRHVLGACLSPHLIYQRVRWLCCLGVRTCQWLEVPHLSPRAAAALLCLPASPAPQSVLNPTEEALLKNWLGSQAPRVLASPGAKVILTSLIALTSASLNSNSVATCKTRAHKFSSQGALTCLLKDQFHLTPCPHVTQVMSAGR